LIFEEKVLAGICRVKYLSTFAVQFIGSGFDFFEDGLKGNPVRIGSYPRSCKVRTTRFGTLLPLFHTKREGAKTGQARRPARKCFFIAFGN